MTTRKQYRIAVAGLSFAGKTSILKRLLTGEFMPTEPTKGFDTEGFERKNVSFLAMDLGGQEAFIQTLWRSFMPQAECLVYVVDASDQELLQRSRDVLLFAISWNPEIKALLVLANKQDLAHASSESEVLERLNLPTVLAENNIQNFRIFGTSAKNGEGIEDAFAWLARQLTRVEDIPVVSIHGVKVFKKVSTLGQETIKKMMEVQVSASEKNAELCEIINENLMISSEEIFNGMIRILAVRCPDGNDYKVVNTVKEDIWCAIVVNAADDNRSVEAMGKEILEYAIMQEEINEPLEEAEIKHLLQPFMEKLTIEEVEEKPAEEIVKEPVRKTVQETVKEIDKQYIRRASAQEESDFFTMMSVMDRIKKIEDR